MKKIYVIRDDVSGLCGEPFVSTNVDDVLRTLSNPKITPSDYLRDISVICLGEFDDLGEVPLIHAHPAPSVVLSGSTIYLAWQSKYLEMKEDIPDEE